MSAPYPSGSQGDVVTGLGERLYRLHQLVEVEAGLENLAVLEVEVIGIGKNDQHVGGLCGKGTCSKDKGESKSADGFHAFSPGEGHSQTARAGMADDPL